MRGKNALRILALLGLVGVLLGSCAPNPETPLNAPLKVISERRDFLGTYVQISVFGLPAAQAKTAIEGGYKAVENLQKWAHPFWSTSEIFALNEAAGKHPVKLSPEHFAVLKTAHDVSLQSQGAFDITFAGVGRLWNLKTPDNFRVPNDAQLRAAVQSVDFRQVELAADKQTAFLKRAASRVSLGGIAKGWAADLAMRALKEHGVGNAIVNAGGDMSMAGDKDGKPWRVGVQDPRKAMGEYCAVLEIEGNVAVATSGDYERYVIHDGVRYHHILDPKTGRPARGCQSVTIVGSTAALADALATAVFVLGPQEGAAMLEKHYPQVDALIIDSAGEAHESSNFGKWLAKGE